MIPTFTIEPTKTNIKYAEKVADLYSDYSLGYITDDELENELTQLKMNEAV